MNTHADNSKENKSKAVAKHFSQKKNSGEIAMRFTNKRQDSQAFSNLNKIANGSPHLKHTAQLKEIANNSQTTIQRQENANPTLQMKKGINVNDDKGLEKEATVMGSRALQLNHSSNTLEGYNLTSNSLRSAKMKRFSSFSNANTIVQREPLVVERVEESKELEKIILIIKGWKDYTEKISLYIKKLDNIALSKIIINLNEKELKELRTEIDNATYTIGMTISALTDIKLNDFRVFRSKDTIEALVVWNGPKAGMIYELIKNPLSIIPLKIAMQIRSKALNFKEKLKSDLPKIEPGKRHQPKSGIAKAAVGLTILENRHRSDVKGEEPDEINIEYGNEKAKSIYGKYGFDEVQDGENEMLMPVAKTQEFLEAKKDELEQLIYFPEYLQPYYKLVQDEAELVEDEVILEPKVLSEIK